MTVKPHCTSAFTNEEYKMPLGKIIFLRYPDGRNQGLMGCRKRIAAIEGLLFLDFETKQDGTKFKATCQGSLQAVETALQMMIEIAGQCKFAPG